MFVFPISYKCEDSLWIKEGDKVKKKRKLVREKGRRRRWRPSY